MTMGSTEWFESGDGHGYVYQYIGPIHYLCECGDYFLNRERWLDHKCRATGHPIAGLDDGRAGPDSVERCYCGERTRLVE